jgi:DNA-binding MarR family transcriptional regulator
VSFVARDDVDDLIDQWRAQRPDLDPDQLASAGTVNRMGRVLARAVATLEAGLAEHGLKLGEFDVLSSLRRHGTPYEATPGELLRQLFLSSGAMTNRLDRLEAAGLVERHPSPDDGRLVVVRLTPAGKRLVERAVETHTATEHRLLGALDDRERRTLDRLARKLLAAP